MNTKNPDKNVPDFLAIKCRVTCCVPASYSVYTVIAGVNLNNLKANHNHEFEQYDDIWTVIAGVNVNSLKSFLEVGGEVALEAEIDGFGE